MKRRILNTINLVVTVTFFWSNCIYAGGLSSYLSIDTQKAFNSAVLASDALQTPLALYKIYRQMDFATLGDLAKNIDEVKVRLLELIDNRQMNITKEEIEQTTSLILSEKDPQTGKPKKDGWKVYYFFNKEGYFIRIRNRDFEDPFYTGFLKGRSQPIEGPIKINGDILDVFKISEDIRTGIEKAIGEIQELLEPEVKAKGSGLEKSEIMDAIEKHRDSALTIDANTVPKYRDLILYAIEYLKNIEGFEDIATNLESIYQKNNIKILKGKGNYISLRYYRKMRYNLIAGIEDVIYIPQGLIEIFLDPNKFENELRKYLGEEIYEKLISKKIEGETLEEFLKRIFIAGLVHEVYEIGEWVKNPSEFNWKRVHPKANEKEMVIAGISPFDGESVFDDITKFLILKELHMKPDINIFDVLRDRRRDEGDILTLGLGFERHGIKSIEEKNVKGHMEELFKEKTQDGDRYYLVTLHGRIIAISKIKKDGTEVVYNPYLNDTKFEGTPYTIEQIIEDYRYMVERLKKPVYERYTVTYQELKEYQKELYRKREEYENLPDSNPKKAQLEKDLEKDALFLAGGKGFSLSWLHDVVDIPAGLTISTTAYFSFIKSNPQLRSFIDRKLQNLDTMDDKAREVVAEEIRSEILSTLIPDDIKREILLMYRYLNILRIKQGKKIPTAVAIRSSGIHEDIEVSTWLPITTGSQAGQADTYLNVIGEDSVIDAVHRCWASLFTGRALSYRDDAVFLIFSSKLGRDNEEQRKNYYRLLGKLREYKYNEIADILTNLKNPGSKKLLDAIKMMIDIEKNNEDKEFLQFCYKVLENTRGDFVDALRLGIGVVVMHMAKSYTAGVGFNVKPGTGYAGKSRALYTAWKGDNQFVVLDSNGNIIATKPMVVSFEISYGYGETVVGGMVEPDRFVMGYNGEKWFILEKQKGSKKVQMIGIEESFKLLSPKINKQEIQQIASIVGNAVSYEEVSKEIVNILMANLQLKYLKAPPDEDLKKKKKMVEEAANNIAEMIKGGETQDKILQVIKNIFKVAEKQGQYGIDGNIVMGIIGKLYKTVENAKNRSDDGLNRLKQYFGDFELADGFIKMLKEIWGNKEYKDLKEDTRQRILEKLGNLDKVQFINLAYLIRALIDKRYTSLILTTETHQNTFTLTDDQAIHIAELIAKICEEYGDDRDIEFAIEVDPTGEIQIEGIEPDGKTTGMQTARIYNIQARPYTAERIDIDIIINRTEIEKEFLNTYNPQPIAKGTQGQNTCVGFVYRCDPNVSIATHGDEINRLKNGELTQTEIALLQEKGIDPTPYIRKGDVQEKKLPIILLLDEATPEHDPIMRLCDAVVTLKGGETSHAAIFCREQGIPGVAGVGKLDKNTGDWIIVDANNGLVYEFNETWLVYYKKNKEFPIRKVKFIFRPYLIPFEEGDPRIGYIMAAEGTSHIVSPTMLSPDDGGISLARAEFKGEEIGINVVAGYGYDLIQKIKNGELREELLTPFQKDIVKKLREHPWIIDEIKERLTQEGYNTFREFVGRKFYYFYNNLGFSLAPNQPNKSRAYDFAQDKVAGLIGSEIFSWPGINPLVGLRGASLEIKGVKDGKGGYQEILSFILEALIEANENTKNQGWFYVFIRTPRELKELMNILKRVADQKKKLPKEIGIMIEVPSNAIYVKEFCEILIEFKKYCEGIGVKFDKLFFSFGTNDYSHLAGKGDRDDPRMKLKIEDPSARSSISNVKELGYFYDTNKDYMPLIDEGSHVMLKLIEQVVKVAKEYGITTSLCGEAITQLIARENYEAAGRIMRILDSFGISMVTKRLETAMLRYDVMRRMDTLASPPSTTPLFRLDERTQVEGVVKGEIVFVEEPQDLIPDELKNLTTEEYNKKVKYLKYNAPERLSRVAGKIVVITKRFADIEQLEKLGIPWDHLQYAKAIILDPNVNTKDWELLNPKNGIVDKRIKGIVEGIANRRSELEGIMVTIDYNTGNVYEGDLPLKKKELPLEGFTIPTEEPDVKPIQAIREDANRVYGDILVNPLILLMYRDGKLTTLRPKLIQYISDLIDEANKIGMESNPDKKKWLIEQYIEKISRQELLISTYFKDKVISKLQSGEEIKVDIENLADTYLSNLEKDIKDLLNGNSVEDYIKNAFKTHMLKIIESAPKGTPVIHTTTSLTSKELTSLIGGFLVEPTNPNPDYGLLGPARALSDYWEINRLELKAFKEVRESYKNLHLQITDLKGTQSGAVLYLYMQVLKDMGLEPGKDGLEIGVNISTPSDTLSIERYIMESGITFVTIDRRRLGGAWLGADIDWKEETLVTEEEIEDVTTGPIRIVKDAIRKHGIKLFELNHQTKEQIESHLLPLYLYELVKKELGYTDEQMTRISYTDSEGKIHIDRHAVEVMGKVLNRELKWRIDTSTMEGINTVTSRVMKVLQAHEELEKSIIDLGIDFSNLREELITYLSEVRDDWEGEFKNIIGEGTGEQRLIRLLEAFLRNYPAYGFAIDLNNTEHQLKLVKELTVHQLVEQAFFRQGVRILPYLFKDVKWNRVKLPNSLQDILGNYLINWGSLRNRNCCYIRLPELIEGIDTNNEVLVKRITEKVLQERLNFVNKDVNYAIAIAPEVNKQTLRWQLEVVKDMIREIYRLTNNPLTITIEASNQLDIQNAFELLNEMGFEKNANLRYGLTVKGKNVDRNLVNTASTQGITQIIPWEEDVSPITAINFNLLLMDILYSKDLPNLDILIPYESLRTPVRSISQHHGFQYAVRLFPTKKLSITTGQIAIRNLIPNQPMVAKFKIDAEVTKLRRGIEEHILVLKFLDEDWEYKYLVLDGHHRVMATLELGNTYCPAYIIEGDPIIRHKEVSSAITANYSYGISPISPFRSLKIADVKRDIMQEVAQSPLAKRLKEGPVVNICETEITDEGLVGPWKVEDQVLYGEIKKDLAQLPLLLEEIRRDIGGGIISGIDGIRIVDNIKPTDLERQGNLVPYSMIKEEDGKRILLLDKDALKDRNRLYLTLLHELREGLLSIVENDIPLRELTSIYLTIKDAIKKGIKNIDDVVDLEEDYQFLKLVEFVKGRSDEEIISAILEFMRWIPYYSGLFSKFPFADKWRDMLYLKRILSKVQTVETRYNAAIWVFNNIAEAKEMVRKVKISEEKMLRMQIDIYRDGLREEYNALRSIFIWYMGNYSDTLFIDTKWRGVASRKIDGSYISQEIREDLQGFWKLLENKGINSIVISNNAFNKMEDSYVRFINLIHDILFRVSETDFLGFAYMNDLSVKVVDDTGGKRVVIGNRLEKQAESLLNWLLIEGFQKTSRLQIPEVKEEKRMAIKVDIDRLSEEDLNEIRNLQNFFLFYFYSSSSQDVNNYLKQKGLKQAQLDGIEDTITLVEPTRLMDIKDREDLKSKYYLPMFYIKGSIYMAAYVVMADGDIEVLKKNGIIEILSSFLGELLGHQPSDEEIKTFLTNPFVLPGIESVLKKLNNLPDMIRMLQMSA